MIEEQTWATNGWVVNIFLRSLRQAAGPFYERVVMETPWQKLSDNPPPDDPAFVVEVGLTGTVHARAYDVLGHDLYLVFARFAALEVGQAVAERVAPLIAPYLHGLDGLPRLSTAARLLLDFAHQHHVLQSSQISEEHNSLRLHINDCGECRYIRSPEPICHYASESFALALSEASGLRIRANETNCRATGRSDECIVRIDLRQQTRPLRQPRNR